MTELEELPAGYVEDLEVIECNVVTSEQRASRTLNLSLLDLPPEERRVLQPSELVAAALAIVGLDTDEDVEAADDE